MAIQRDLFLGKFALRRTSFAHDHGEQVHAFGVAAPNHACPPKLKADMLLRSFSEEEKALSEGGSVLSGNFLIEIL